VVKIEDGPDVFIDRHFIHEVTSPVAFLGLKERESRFYIQSVLCHCRSQYTTINQHLPVEDALSANQLKALEDNAAEWYFALGTRKKTESFT
jgi:3-isopropylmalate/(R)-2-methylmalate dehydratase large subunit